MEHSRAIFLMNPGFVLGPCSCTRMALAHLRAEDLMARLGDRDETRNKLREHVSKICFYGIVHFPDHFYEFNLTSEDFFFCCCRGGDIRRGRDGSTPY